FLPGMFGLGIASVYALGPWMLISLPLIVGFVLMVTAVTYQFRGWLGTLMVNKRRRRTIVAFVTGSLILISQAPNLIQLTFRGTHHREPDQAAEQYARDFQQLQTDLNSHKITAKQFQERFEALSATHQKKRNDENRRLLATLQSWVSLG